MTSLKYILYKSVSLHEYEMLFVCHQLFKIVNLFIGSKVI